MATSSDSETAPTGGKPRRPPRYGIALFLFFLCWYAFLTYGAPRTPDEEVVFRTGEALATRGSSAITGLESWPGFGTPRGKDGKEYSLFGPLEPILLVPFIVTARAIDTTWWHKGGPLLIPISPYASISSNPMFYPGTHLLNWEPHAVRFVASFFNVIIGSLTVLVFYMIIVRLTRSRDNALIAAVIFGAGTLMQTYSGTMFSEPLTTLLALWSFYLLIGAAPRSENTGGSRNSVHTFLMIGLFLGCSVASHVTAVLFFPFFLYHAVYPSGLKGRSTPGRWKSGTVLFLGFAAIIVLLGVYNYVRFGSFIETGRTVEAGGSDKYGYGEFVSPLTGFFGLCFGLGKGLLWYSPAILLSIPGWKLLWRRDRSLAAILLGMITFRFLFISSRSDWTGGLGLGPRFLVPIIPFMILPVGLWIDEQMRSGSWRKLCVTLGAAQLCVLQQWYFSIGDVIEFYFRIIRKAILVHDPILKGVKPYGDSSWSPLFHFFEMPRAPFTLQPVSISQEMLFILGGVVLFIIMNVCLRLLYLHWSVSTDKAAGYD